MTLIICFDASLMSRDQHLRESEVGTSKERFKSQRGLS